jgi:WD40 repeat protein
LTLDTVRTPFQGHTNHIQDLALSFDCALLVSSSHDNTIKFWAFESRQLLASFDVHNPCTLILSPKARQVTYTVCNSQNIFICNIAPNILATIWPGQEVPIGLLYDTLSHMLTPSYRPMHSTIHKSVTHSMYVIQFLHSTTPLTLSQSDATIRPAAMQPAAVSFANKPSSQSPTIYQQMFFALRHLRKLLPFSFRRDAVLLAGIVEPRDPLDVCVFVLSPQQST